MQTIRSTRVDLEDKLSSLSILDHNPQKPVVRMANLCVVSSHTVRGPSFKFEPSFFTIRRNKLVVFCLFQGVIMGLLLQVNGVAQLHSDILKDELFADYVSIWPNKFQNKTNGITPRRWLRFCSPELSDIITKWLKTDKWITDLDLLTGLRQVWCLFTWELNLQWGLILSFWCYFCSASLPTMKNSNLSGLLQRRPISNVWLSI